MENKAVYKISESVVYTHVCEVPVLAVTRESFDETDVAASVLNDSGAFIWNCLGKGMTVGEIIRQVASEFEEEEETVREGVTAFLETLKEQNMIFELENDKNDKDL